MQIETGLHAPHAGHQVETLGLEQDRSLLLGEGKSEGCADSFQLSENARLLLSGEDIGTADSLPGQGERGGIDLTKPLSDRSVVYPVCTGSHHISIHGGEGVQAPAKSSRTNPFLLKPLKTSRCPFPRLGTVRLP